MIYHFSFYLKHYWPIFNIFHYVSVRSIVALLTSFGMFLLCGPVFMACARRFFRSKVREWTPESHKLKDSMPTMGGVFILAVTIVNTLIWCNLTCPFVWIFLLCMIGFG